MRDDGYHKVVRWGNVKVETPHAIYLALVRSSDTEPNSMYLPRCISRKPFLISVSTKSFETDWDT